jgi:hypothetical protein
MFKSLAAVPPLSAALEGKLHDATAEVGLCTRC